MTNPLDQAVTALAKIADMAPATQEMDLPSSMAQIASDALSTLKSQQAAPVSEGVGLEPGDLEWLRDLLTRQKVFPATSASVTERDATIDRLLSSLRASTPSDAGGGASGLVEALIDGVMAWVNRLPIPTTGATFQLMQLAELKAILASNPADKGAAQ